MTRRNYGDNDFAGLGIIKCEACGNPLRDHPIRPCGEFGSDRITVPRPSQRGHRQGEHPDTVRQRTRRAKANEKE